MKHVYLTLVLFGTSIALSAQTLTLDELLNLTAVPAGKFQQYAGKKGFQTEALQKDYVRMHYSRDTSNVFYLSRQWNNEGGWLQLEKLTAEDYVLLKQNMKKGGFATGIIQSRIKTEYFEKGPLLITATPEIDLEEGRRLYNLVIRNKNLPKAKDLQFAEYLLQLESHLQLEYVFGKENVIKDQFLQPDGTTTPCSVIHPQSPYEAVFIWKDAANHRDLKELRIGGNPRTKGALRYNNAVAQNRWISRQGVYPTMSLDQLCTRNEGYISFFGWGEEKSGTLQPGNTGKLDLTRLSFVFSCFNCNDEKYYGDRAHNAADVIKDYRKVHITTMVLKPTPPEELTASGTRN